MFWLQAAPVISARMLLMYLKKNRVLLPLYMIIFLPGIRKP